MVLNVSHKFVRTKMCDGIIGGRSIILSDTLLSFILLFLRLQPALPARV